MTTAGLIDTDAYSNRLRAKAIDVATRRILITNFEDSQQAQDLTVPPNCDGFGRIRHFHRTTSNGWPPNPLPIDPANHALGRPRADKITAQVFQNAACNWRCWYCYVPFELLSANESRASWLTADQLIELYLKESDRPSLIDLTGGQPDLTPEWIPWMMAAIEAHGLKESVYLWSDDNLSNDYYHRFLSPRDRDVIRHYPKYGRVCCFKGYDPTSFSFNTRAAPELFSRQFELFERLLDEGLDLYAYVTLTTADSSKVADEIPRFVDRLQSIHPNLPLRTVPLEIQMYSPLEPRMNLGLEDAMRHQWAACEVWKRELDQRFSAELRSLEITSVPLVSPAT